MWCHPSGISELTEILSQFKLLIYLGKLRVNFLEMANLACLICDSPTVIKPENIHETNQGPESGIQTEASDGNALRSEVFHIFCQQMGVHENSHSQAWNSDSHGPPFCPPCRQTVTEVFHLKSQLQCIQNDLDGILHTVRQKVQSMIDETSKDDVDDIDQRIVNFRYAMIESKPSKSKESNQVTSEHLSVSGNESAKDEGVAPEEVLLSSESDSSSSHSDWSPSKVGRNTHNYPKRSRKKARGSDCQDAEGDDEVKEISGESSDSDTGNEYISGTKKRGKSNSNSKDGHSDNQVLVKSADVGTLEYYGFRFQSVSDEFICLECPQSTFADKGQLFAHIREKHLGRTTGYYCSICGKHCDSPSALRTHETCHSDIRDWMCCKCGKGFKNDKNLKRHMKETHKLDLQLCCFLCLEKFNSHLDMKSHIKSEHMDGMSQAGKSTYCDSCGKTFKSEEIRQQHLKVHEDDKFFKCHYCEKLYLQKDNIKVHFAKDHGVGV